MKVPQPRIRPRFTLLTALVFFAAICSQMAFNTIPQLRSNESSPVEGWQGTFTTIEYGWPRIYSTDFADCLDYHVDYQPGFSWTALAFNIAVGLGIALGSAASTELILGMSRRRASGARDLPGNIPLRH